MHVVYLVRRERKYHTDNRPITPYSVDSLLFLPQGGGGIMISLP